MSRTAAVLAAAGFLVIAAFQLALALGAPWGEAAWGGRWRGTLPTRLRVASGVAVLVWVAGTLVLLSRAGLEVVPVPSSVVRWGAWALVGLLALGAVMNALSTSRWERFVWAPLALALAVLTFIVALAA